jgi:5-formyltetrahydrofolate cyclo-ligase
VLALKEYQTAGAISVFLSMPGKEVSTTEVVRDALKAGKEVFVPYIYEVAAPEGRGKVMDMLRLRSESDLDSLKPDAWGIPTLSDDSVSLRQNALGGYGLESDSASPQLDLIFVPSVAFDHERRRLGHGRGFYDRYLERYSSAATRCGSRMPLLGWCHSFSYACSPADSPGNSRLGPEASASP